VAGGLRAGGRWDGGRWPVGRLPEAGGRRVGGSVGDGRWAEAGGIGGLEDWRIGGLEDWRIGGLEDWRPAGRRTEGRRARPPVGVRRHLRAARFVAPGAQPFEMASPRHVPVFSGERASGD
jgi:hypothetical protein